jgi:hypothetical protein
MGLGSFCLFCILFFSVLVLIPEVGWYGWGMNVSHFRKRSLEPVKKPNDCLETAKLLLLHPDMPNGGHSAHQQTLIAALLAGAGGPTHHTAVDDPETKRRS